MKRLVVVALLAMACRGPLAVHVDGDNQPTWATAPLIEERVITAADTAAREWGGSSADLDGWTITLTSNRIGGDPHLMGLTTPDDVLGFDSGGDIWVSTRSSRLCAELTTLAHEIGHAIIGDPRHRDGRWRGAAFWRAMAVHLAASVPEVDAECMLALAEPDGRQLFH